MKTNQSKSIQKRFTNTPTQQLISVVFLGLNGIAILFSLGFLVKTMMQLNKTDVPPQEGQLLNRPSIEKAAQLIQEQTVVFENASDE